MPRRWFVWCAVAVAAAAAGLGIVGAWHELRPDPALQSGAGRDATASPAASFGADDAATGDAALRRAAAEAAGDLDRQPATAARLASMRVLLAVDAMPR